MHFLAPYWLYGLLLVPILTVFAVLVKRSRSRAWQQLVAPRLRDKLVKQATSTRHWFALVLSLLAFCCVILALARPYQGEETTLEKINSRNILIAIDTSRSMLCQDISSNRLTAAKSMALQMLERFPTDRIGVLAFAGSSNVLAPLTIDHIAVHDTIAQLDSNSLPVDGSNLAEAISNGVETLKATEKRANALVVFSDGEEHDSGIDKAIKEANEAGVQIITIGVGSASGGIIPSSSDNEGKHRNNKGEVVHTRLQADLLKQLALKTNGAYTSINNQPETVIAAAIDKMDSFEQEGRAQIIPHERYMWFLTPAVVLALLSAFVRAGWKGNSIALALLLISLTTQHSDAEESWLERTKYRLFTQPAAEKKAYEALRDKEFSNAIQYFEAAQKGSEGEDQIKLSNGLGLAHYRAGNYEKAAKAFTKSLLSNDKKTQARAQYNLGNALYKDQWSEFKGIGKTPLKDYLVQQIQGQPKAQPKDSTEEAQKKLTVEDLDAIERNFSNALEKYSSSQSLIPFENTAENISNTEKVIKMIQQAREEIKKQQKKDDKKQDKKDDKKDQKEKKDPKDNKDQKKGSKDKKDQDGKKDQQQKKDQQGGEKQQDNDGKQGEKKDPNSEEEDSEKKDQSGDKKDDSQKKEGEQKDQSQQDGDKQNAEEKSGEQKNGEKQNAQQGQNPAQSASKPEKSKNGYTVTEQEARKLLERNADLQKRPATPRRNKWKINKPEFDW